MPTVVALLIQGGKPSGGMRAAPPLLSVCCMQPEALVMEGAERYIAGIERDAVRMYADNLWRYLCGRGEWEPDPPFFGLAPIEVATVDRVLRAFCRSFMRVV